MNALFQHSRPWRKPDFGKFRGKSEPITATNVPESSSSFVINNGKNQITHFYLSNYANFVSLAIPVVLDCHSENLHNQFFNFQISISQTNRALHRGCEMPQVFSAILGSIH